MSETVSVGSRLTSRRTVTAADITMCARVTGDFGSHHVAGMAGRQVAQGLLTVATVPLIDHPTAEIVKLSLQFIAPVFADDTIEAATEVVGLERADDGSATVAFTLTVVNGSGAEVLRGEGSAVLPDAAPPAK